MKKIIMTIVGVALCSIIAASWFAYNYFLTPTSPDCLIQQNMTSYTNTLFPKHIPFKQKNGFINDASCLSQTPIYGIVDVRTEKDIQSVLQFAQEHDLNVTAMGVRHSMGGQAFYDNAILLDMRHFNGMSLDYDNKTITVQSGATWKQIQEFLHPYELSVKAMQSSNIFSVGGSISVNAHGMDHQTGSVASTIKSLGIMLADGSIKEVSPTQDKELFNLVVGGYGLFGIILDAVLTVTPNVMYEEKKFNTTLDKLPDVISTVLSNPDIKIFYAHLSTSPITFLNDAIVFTYVPYTKENIDIPPLHATRFPEIKRMLLNTSKKTFTGRLAKWILEKYFDDCEIIVKGTGECLISRNAVMYDSVEYLQSNMRNQTDILHEYFVPQENLVSFIKQMKTTIMNHNATLLNCSIRLVHKENNFLTYARRPLVAVVLYLNQNMSKRANKDMEKLTQSLINIAHAHGGTFFLPYQLYFTHEQLLQSYPQWNAFVKKKLKYDPEERFTQNLYEKYKNQ